MAVAPYASLELRATRMALVLEVQHSDPAVPTAVLQMAWSDVPPLVGLLMEQWEAHRQRLAVGVEIRADRQDA